MFLLHFRGAREQAHKFGDVGSLAKKAKKKKKKKNIYIYIRKREKPPFV